MKINTTFSGYKTVMRLERVTIYGVNKKPSVVKLNGLSFGNVEYDFVKKVFCPLNI